MPQDGGPKAAPAGSDSRSSEERRSAHGREAEPRPSDRIIDPGPSTSSARRVAPSEADADPGGALVRLIEEQANGSVIRVRCKWSGSTGVGPCWMRVRGF